MSRRPTRLVLVLTLVVGASVAASIGSPIGSAAGPCETYQLDKSDRLQFTELDNASGMVASRTMDGVFWAHNDRSGSSVNALYAIDGAGRRLATVVFNLSGSNPTVPGDFVDLEDIAIGPGGQANVDYLYLADTGDNDRNRSEVAIYRFVEPQFNPDPNNPKTLNVAESAMEATRFTYQQPADPSKTHSRDAEAIIVDPHEGDLYIFEKGTHSLPFFGLPDDGAGPVYSAVYRINRPKLFTKPTVLRAKFVAPIRHRFPGQSLEAKITGADISLDGSTIVVRNTESAFMWFRGRNQTIASVFEDYEPACFGPDGTRGESVAILPDGSAFYGLREGSDPLSPVFKAEIVGYPSPGYLCEGLHATIVGTNAGETLVGTSGDDVIVGLGGKDIIDGGLGDDVICAGSGNDIVDGGGGRDVIYGGWGKDKLLGGVGVDFIFGGLHGDTIKGQGGGDRVYGGDHQDVIWGNNGRDRIRGDRASDSLDGGGSADDLRGNVGDDTLDGGSGIDVCDGGSGVDITTSCETESNIP